MNTIWHLCECATHTIFRFFVVKIERSSLRLDLCCWFSVIWRTPAHQRHACVNYIVLPAPFNRQERKIVAADESENWWKMAIVCGFNVCAFACVCVCAFCVHSTLSMNSRTHAHTDILCVRSAVQGARKIATHPCSVAQQNERFDFSDCVHHSRLAGFLRHHSFVVVICFGSQSTATDSSLSVVILCTA